MSVSSKAYLKGKISVDEISNFINKKIGRVKDVSENAKYEFSFIIFELDENHKKDSKISTRQMFVSSAKGIQGDVFTSIENANTNVTYTLVSLDANYSGKETIREIAEYFGGYYIASDTEDYVEVFDEVLDKFSLKTITLDDIRKHFGPVKIQDMRLNSMILDEEQHDYAKNSLEQRDIDTTVFSYDELVSLGKNMFDEIFSDVGDIENRCIENFLKKRTQD